MNSYKRIKYDRSGRIPRATVAVMERSDVSDSDRGALVAERSELKKERVFIDSIPLTP